MFPSDSSRRCTPYDLSGETGFTAFREVRFVFFVPATALGASVSFNIRCVANLLTTTTANLTS